MVYIKIFLTFIIIFETITFVSKFIYDRYTKHCRKFVHKRMNRNLKILEIHKEIEFKNDLKRYTKKFRTSSEN